MKYAYEDLSDGQFESLIVFICQRLLGISVQGFAPGADGGRDAKFHGTADLHPSKTSPWTGITIIQAKHTRGINKHFSESDFYNIESNSNILAKEILRIKALRQKKQLDNYMLFSNRKLTGIAESEIRTYLSKECDIPQISIYLCGTQQLESWFKLPEFSDIPSLANLDPVDSPLNVSPDDLAEVVHALAREKNTIVTILDDPPTQRVTFQAKNEINTMTEDYAAAQLRKYLKQTAQIRSFLSAPGNIELLRLYESIVDEFQLKIISKKKDFQTFDEVMEYLVKLLFDRDAVLRQHKRLTRAILFYMYWNCDIGETPDAPTN
ncbi:MAG: ABC-three component system protein [Verrucomicrobiota bacterium]